MVERGAAKLSLGWPWLCALGRGKGGRARGKSERLGGESEGMEAWRSSASALEEQEHVAAMVGHAPLHDELVDISSNRWRAIVWPQRDAVLGRLRAELHLGPKSKVEAHELLYNFY